LARLLTRSVNFKIYLYASKADPLFCASALIVWANRRTSSTTTFGGAFAPYRGRIIAGANTARGSIHTIATTIYICC